MAVAISIRRDLPGMPRKAAETFKLRGKSKGRGDCGVDGAFGDARSGDSQEMEAGRARGTNREASGGRSAEPSGVFGRRGARLSKPGAFSGDIVRRRGAAHPASDADWL